MNYQEFIKHKSQLAHGDGFEPTFMPEFLYGFQRSLTEWAVRTGRDAIFADCGMGKTPMQLVWAENVVRHTNKPVLILSPLSVSIQTVQEAEKFGIDAARSRDGKHDGKARAVVTNYEQLHHFSPHAFGGVVCDESSIIKNFDGSRKGEITEFMKKTKYRMLCTATASPNDYIELGTSSEALGTPSRTAWDFPNTWGDAKCQPYCWTRPRPKHSRKTACLNGFGAITLPAFGMTYALTACCPTRKPATLKTKSTYTPCSST